MSEDLKKEQTLSQKLESRYRLVILDDASLDDPWICRCKGECGVFIPQKSGVRTREISRRADGLYRWNEKYGDRWRFTPRTRG